MEFQEHDIEWSGEKVSRMWNYYQRVLTSGTYFGEHSGEHVAYLINKQIGFSRLRKVVDLSCGRGDIIKACLPYLRDSQRIYGTDFSRASIESVNSRFDDVAQFGEAHHIEAFPASFPDGQFDLVISTEVVEHLTDQELDNMMAEADRILSSAGFIFITTPNEEDLNANTAICPDCGCKFHHWQHMRSWSARSLKERMEGYGFRTTSVIPIAWAETPIKRAIFTVAAKIKLKAKTGLVYIGQKS